MESAFCLQASPSGDTACCGISGEQRLLKPNCCAATPLWESDFFLTLKNFISEKEKGIYDILLRLFKNHIQILHQNLKNSFQSQIQPKNELWPHLCLPLSPSHSLWLVCSLGAEHAVFELWEAFTDWPCVQGEEVGSRERLGDFWIRAWPESRAIQQSH